MSPSATSPLPTANHSVKAVPPAAIDHDTLATSSVFQLFSPAETARYRALAPAVDGDADGAADAAVTYVNSGYRGIMNLRIKAALDEYLAQAIGHPAPKALWQAQAAAALAALAAHLHVPASSLVFTRDTTEGLNLFQRSLRFEPGDNVVVLQEEHPNQVYGWLALEDGSEGRDPGSNFKSGGLHVRRVPSSADFADADTFAPYIDARTRCIGLSSVMFHSGQLNDVADICARFRPHGIHVLVDLTQHVGAAPLDLAAWHISAASMATHKALACPTGLAALYVDPAVVPDLTPTPPFVGTGAVANVPADAIAVDDPTSIVYHPSAQRFAHPNVNLVAAVALGASLQLLDGDIHVARLESHLRALGRELILRLDALGIAVVGSRLACRRSPHIYTVPLLHPHWQPHFRRDHVYVSHNRRGVRVSFGFYNALRDVDAFVQSVACGLAQGIPKA